MIESAVTFFAGEFTLADLELKCAHASRDMVRTVLRNLQKAGKVECLDRGPGELHGESKEGNTLKRG